MAAIPKPKQNTPPRGLSGNMDEIFLGNIYDATVVKRLLAYARRYPGTVFAVALGMLGYISAVVAQPLIIAQDLPRARTQVSTRFEPRIRAMTS